MKHIKLFESFDPFAAKVGEMLDALRQDPEIGHYNLSVEELRDVPFLIWNNPADDEKWRESGYGEEYDGDFSQVNPMNVLALWEEDGGQLFAYKLTPEEKYYGVIISDEGDYYNEDQLVKIDSSEDLKRALHESIWEMA